MYVDYSAALTHPALKQKTWRTRRLTAVGSLRSSTAPRITPLTKWKASTQSVRCGCCSHALRRGPHPPSSPSGLESRAATPLASARLPFGSPLAASHRALQPGMRELSRLCMPPGLFYPRACHWWLRGSSDLVVIWTSQSRQYRGDGVRLLQFYHRVSLTSAGHGQ